jgi:hypothetical protein
MAGFGKTGTNRSDPTVINQTSPADFLLCSSELHQDPLSRIRTWSMSSIPIGAENFTWPLISATETKGTLRGVNSSEFS